MAQQNEVLHQAARTVSSDADSGCALDEYTWVPPGLTAQQVPDCCLKLCYSKTLNVCVHIS